MTEAGDSGRHERLVTVEEFGRQEGFHQEEHKDVLLFVLKIIRNGLKEVALYPENFNLNIKVTY